jgi:hypothetical protein
VGGQASRSAAASCKSTAPRLRYDLSFPCHEHASPASLLASVSKGNSGAEDALPPPGYAGGQPAVRQSCGSEAPAIPLAPARSCVEVENLPRRLMSPDVGGLISPPVRRRRSASGE